MNFELVDIITKDQLIHQGMVRVPDHHGKMAVIWIHGLTGTFYSNTKLKKLLATECDKLGIAFGAFHTRGHDGITSVRKLDGANEKGYVYETIGAGVEQFQDCVKDIDAMVTYFVDNGFGKIVLVGSSSGANKVCYYAGTHTDPRVAGVVLASPMSDRYEAENEPTYHETKALMEQKISEGKGNELLVGHGYFPLTPNRWKSLYIEGSLEDVFNYRDTANALTAFAKINKPMLVLFGGKDEHSNRPIEEIQLAFDSHKTSPNYKSVIVPGADHGFSSKEDEFVRNIVSFTSSV